MVLRLRWGNRRMDRVEMVSNENDSDEDGFGGREKGFRYLS